MERLERSASITPAEFRPGAGEFFEVVPDAAIVDSRHLLAPGALQQRVYASEDDARAVAREQGLGAQTKLRPRSGDRGRGRRGAAVRLREKLLFSDAGTFPLRLPWDRKRYVVRAEDILTEHVTSYTYHGGVYEAGVRVGGLLVIRRAGKRFGKLTIGDVSYVLEPVGRGYCALLEEYPAPAGSTCAADRGHGGGGDGRHGGLGDDALGAATSVSGRAARGREVRVLVLFTDAADDAGDPQAEAETGIAELNRALTNSGITTGQLRFRLAGVQRLAGFNERANNPGGDRDRLLAFGNVANARLAAEADLVVLLTDGNYNAGFGQIFGVAFIEPTGPNQGVAIVELDAPGARRTFAHEVAHTLGGQHRGTPTAGLANVGAFAQSHEYTTGWWIFRTLRQTILDPAGGGEERLVNFSNPDVERVSQPTGIANQRDNARQLRAQAQNVACYVDVPRLEATVAGPAALNPGRTADFTATVRNCNGPLGFRWERSDNGTSYRSAGTGATVRITAANTLNLYVRVTVTCGGEAVRAFRTVYVGGGSEGGCGPGTPCFVAPEQGGASPEVMADGVSARGASPDGAGSETTLGPSVAVYPNPVSGPSATVELTAARPGDVLALREGATGRVMWERALGDDTAPALSVREIDVASLSPGAYVLTLTTDGGVASAPLLVTGGRP